MLPGCFLSIEYRVKNKKQRPRLIPTEVKRAERIIPAKELQNVTVNHHINSSFHQLNCNDRREHKGNQDKFPKMKNRTKQSIIRGTEV